MLTYVVQRVIQGIIVIFLVSITTFCVLQLAPGSPIDIMVGEARITDEQIQRIEEKWGLNDPWYIQYFTWLGNVLTGDLGDSIVRRGMSVQQMLAEAAPVTLRLNLLAFIVSTSIAVPLGILAAIKRHSPLDYGSMVAASIGIAMPNYWIGLMLVILFSLQLGWLPPYGSSGLKAYILPVAVLAIQEMAILARLTRGSTVELLGQDFVTTARSKGLRESTVVFRHVVRNAMLPIVTLIGYRLAFILSGTIVVETVFAWPGIGRLFFTSVTRLDYQVVQSIVLLLSVLVVVGNLVTDLIYAYVDPRIRIR